MVLYLTYCWRQDSYERAALRRRIGAVTRELETAYWQFYTEQDRMRATADSGTELLLRLDKDLRLTYANSAAQGIFGHLRGDPSLIRYCRAIELEDLAKEAVEHGSAAEKTINLRGLLFRARAIPSEGAVHIALLDISELQRLRQSRKELIANLADDLRTPLASLRLLTETLNEAAGRGPKIEERLPTEISTEPAELEQITRGMHDLAAIETGKQVTRVEPIPLDEITAEALLRVQEQVRNTGAKIRAEVGEGLIVLADKAPAARGAERTLQRGEVLAGR